MTVPAFHVEAKLHAFRKTQEGVVVSFVVSPIDMPSQLALDPLGTRYQLALCAIGDDEQPLPASQRQPVAPAPSLSPAGLAAAEGSGEGARTGRVASSPGASRYRDASPMEKARTRAGILASDQRFCAWVASAKAGGGARRMYAVSEKEAAIYIREHCCDGKSRGLIAEDPECYRKFLALETMFKIAVGELAEPR